MKYNSLFTFGCSWTYGFGLPDMFHLSGPRKDHNIAEVPTNFTKKTYKPHGSNWAWGKQLAGLLGDNIPFYNFAVSGASNKEIVHWITKCIQNNMIEPNDLVVIMWTSIGTRWMMYDGDEPINQFPPGLPGLRIIPEEDIVFYADYHNLKEASIVNLQYMHYANLMLNEIGATVKNYYTNQENKPSEQFPHITSTLNLTNAHLHEDRVDFAEEYNSKTKVRQKDKHHGGVQAHTKTALRIHKNMLTNG